MWKQPEPTKAYAVYMNGNWYGEGDDSQAAWDNARRQIAPDAHPINREMWNKLRHFGKARMSLGLAGSQKWPEP